MQQPLVSIVMPAYNAEKYIEASVNSIINQSYTDFELLIADDCSSDKTRDFLQTLQDTRISIVYNESNQGYLKTCNALFALCKGELVTFQDADDLSVQNRIEKQVNQFLKDNELAICTTNSLMINAGGKKIMSRKWPVDYGRFRADVNYEALLCGATIMLKNELLKEIGFYHEYFNRLGGEDYEWFFRAVCKGKGIHLNEELYLYRIHNSAVKVNNTAARTIYIHDIIHEIRKHYLVTGEYLLDGKHDDKLNELERSFEKAFQQEPSKVFRIKANSAIALKQYTDFFRLSWLAFKLEPFSSKNYEAFFTSMYNRFKGIIYNLVKPD